MQVGILFYINLYDGLGNREDNELVPPSHKDHNEYKLLYKQQKRNESTNKVILINVI